MRMGIERRKRRGWFGLALCLGLNLLTGCKEKSVDYDVGGMTESGQVGTNGGERGLNQFTDAPAWKDEWTAVNTKGNAVTLSIDAQISVPQAEQMSVVEVKEPEFDAAYKESVAKRIFGGEEVYYNDPEHLPKKELEKLRMRCLEWMDDRAEDAEAVKELETELSGYDELLKTAKDTYTLVDAYDVDEYLLEHDGISYELVFGEIENDSTVSDAIYKSKRVRLHPKDISEVCPEEWKGKSMYYYNLPSIGTAVENQCKFSEEEAQKLAQRFVDELDMGYSVLGYSKPLFWEEVKVSDEIPNYMPNGYIFCYDAGIDGVSFTSFGTQGQYMNYGKKKGVEGEWYQLDSTLEVYVTDKGVIEMDVINPVEITGISGETGLLPLREVEGIVKKQINEHFGTFRFDYPADDRKVTFNKMELIYFRIRDRKNPGHYSYVPTWRLSEVTEYEYELRPLNFFIRNPVLINAIDGSVIDFYDEV